MSHKSVLLATFLLIIGCALTMSAQQAPVSSRSHAAASADQASPATDGTITGVIAGTDLTGGGTSGTVTLNVDTTKVPQLDSANAFTGNQTVEGNLSVSGRVGASTFSIGGYRFASGNFNLGNSFLGFAGNTKTTGNWNTATGVDALAANTQGVQNTANGYQALSANQGAVQGGGYVNVGAYNTAVGAFALQSNTMGDNNTAVGSGALQHNVGNLSGCCNASGWYNTAVGSTALSANIDGNANTASGFSALAANTSGNNNTAAGWNSLVNNTTGGSNTADGSNTLQSNTTGTLNTGVGVLALSANTTGTDNTAIGVSALTANTTGYDNISVGGLASNTTGSENTCIGSGCDVATGNLTNATAIGASAVVGESNALVLGSVKGVKGASSNVNVGIGTTTPANIFTIAQGAGDAIADGWSTYSSRRWKTNIQPLQGALEKVEQLRGVSYDLKANGKHEVGVIAEEVGAVVPEVVTWEENGKDARSVDYSRLTALLIEATKEQQALIHEQQEQIRTQQAQMKLQQAQIARLGSQVNAIRTALKTGGAPAPLVRTTKAEAATVRQ
jgi:trimeric autotransporter adhesin